MRRDLRKNQILKRKNFLPTLVVTILLWILLGLLVYFVDPTYFGAIFSFFVLVFMALLFTISLFFASSRRGLIGAISIVFYLFLAYLGIGNYLNLVLIIAIAVCIELYFGAKQ